MYPQPIIQTSKTSLSGFKIAATSMLTVFHSKVHLKDLWRLLASASSNAKGVVPEGSSGRFRKTTARPFLFPVATLPG